MYVIIGTERHPDRFVSEEIYGPFDDYHDAWAKADELEESDFNKLPTGYKQYDYSVRELAAFPLASEGAKTT